MIEDGLVKDLPLDIDPKWPPILQINTSYTGNFGNFTIDTSYKESTGMVTLELDLSDLINDYNNKISDLQQDIGDMQNTIDDLKTAINCLINDTGASCSTV